MKLRIGNWLFVAFMVSAGTADAGSEAPGVPGDRLEDVIVTAQRREEKLQEVPVSVTAFSETAIREAGIRSTADFTAMTPNVTFDQSFTVGNSFVTMRGVEQINNADSPVAIVVDGVPQGNQKQLKMDLFDVDRIEILKGPQGALYGRNAIGGAINIITKQPTNDVTGFLQAGSGSGSEKEAVFALSGPIVKDKLLFRASGEYKDSDGQITNSYLHEKVDFYTAKDVRAKLQWIASDTLNADLRYAHSDTKGGATYDVAIPTTTPDPTNIQNVDPHADMLGTSNLSSDEATLKVDWKIADGTATWISGWTKLHEIYLGSLGFCNPVDCPGGFFGLGDVSQQQILGVKLLSHELRFTSDAHQPVRYIAGAYYLDTMRDLHSIGILLDIPGQPHAVDSNEHNKNKAYAGFAQLDWDLTGRTTLGMSGRYDKDRRDQVDLATGHERTDTFDAFQPKATLAEKFTEGQLGYMTLSTGFRSGGFNGIGLLQPFKRELLRNFEVGYKSTWLEQRLIVNVAAFVERDTDFQFFYISTLTSGAPQVIANLGSVELKGGEIETQAVLAPGWTAYLNVGLLDSSIRDFNPNIGVPAAVGNKTPKTVPQKLNLGTQKSWVFTGCELALRADYEHRGRKYWDSSNANVMNPVNLLSARGSLKIHQWELSLSGHNLLNKYYFEDYNGTAFSGLPVNIGWPAQPRSWEAKIRYDF